MGVYILKRKNYGLAEMAVKGAKGMNPVSSIAQDALNNAIANPIEFANQEAKTYQPTVVNAYAPNQGLGTEVQKQYGIAGTLYGAGKGLLKYGKQHLGTIGSTAAFGAGLTGATYGYNRYQADKAEIEAGTRKDEGLSTNEKLGAAGITTATAAGVGLKTAMSHDKAVKTAKDAFQKNSQAYAGAVRDFQSGKLGSSVANDLAQKSLNRKSAAADTLNKLNRTRMGGLMSNKTFKVGRNALITTGIAAGTALLANAGLKKASQNKAKNETSQRNQSNQNVTQSQYSDLYANGLGSEIRRKLIYKPVKDVTVNIKKGMDGLLSPDMKEPAIKFREAMYAVPVVGSALGRVIKSKLAGGVSALGKSGNAVAQQGYGQLIKQNIQNGTWSNIGNAAGAAISGGTQQLVKGAGNMFTLGRADKLINKVASGMKEHGGETGAKAANFLRNHKTLAVGATGATVGGALFDVSNKAGEKAVNALTSLDSKTNEFKAKRELSMQQMQNQ